MAQHPKKVWVVLVDGHATDVRDDEERARGALMRQELNLGAMRALSKVELVSYVEDCIAPHKTA